MNNLYRKIKDFYNKGNYRGVIVAFEKYINNYNVGIDLEIIDCYAKSLSYLGKKEEASKISKFYSEFYENTVINLHNAVDCLRVSNYEKAKQFLFKSLEKYPFYDSAYYYLGIIAVEEGEYEKAITYLNKVIKINNNQYLLEKAKNLLNKIDQFQKYGKTVQLKYSSFKKQNLILNPGHAVRIKLDVKFDNIQSLKRPYLIYDIIGDKVYALPLKINPNNKYYIIRSLYDYPVQVSPNPVSFQKQDIVMVDGEIDNDEYDAIIKDAYLRHLRLFYLNSDLQLEKVYKKNRT